MKKGDILAVLQTKKIVSEFPKLSEINSISQLGTGASHLNYLITTSSSKIVFRKDIDKTSKNKLKREYTTLKAIEKLKISPKPFHFQLKSKVGSFMLLEYINGHVLSKTSYELDSRLITKLAKEVALLHSIPISKLSKKLPKEFQNFEYYLYELKEYEKQFRPLVKSLEFYEFLKKMYDVFRSHFKNYKFKYGLSLIHSDVQEQNIIVSSKNLKFIDWESAMISDPATEVSYIVTQFGKPFSLSERNLFLREYLTYKKDKSLRERVELYIPIKYYIDFLWSVLQTAKIRKGLIDYPDKNKKVLQQIEYTKICITRLVDNKIIDKETLDFLSRIIQIP